MKLKRALEQHLAVFGESGSGKTVLLSSFYGAAQEPLNLKENLFRVVADDPSQGTQLHRNYLGMKDSARLPEPNRFSATSYAFSVKLKDSASRKQKSRPFDLVRLIWHDYPGEWFEQGVSGPEEARRRVDTFRSLLSSDVALILVDGQRLLDNAGEEERYLKSLLTNFRNGLVGLKDELLVGGQPLVTCPRIWILALSKADLLPEMDVFSFRDLLIEKAADEIDELRTVLGELVEASDAMSVGEDFLLLSSAEFQPGKIEVSKRVGLELLLPLAAILPVQRHVAWAQAMQNRGRVAENLLEGIDDLLVVLAAAKVPAQMKRFLRLAARRLKAVEALAGPKLREFNAAAVAEHDSLRAMLTRFGMDLDGGEDDCVLLRSRR